MDDRDADKYPDSNSNQDTEHGAVSVWGVPLVGYFDEEGHTVLPAEMYYSGDDGLYDDYFPSLDEPKGKG